MMMVGEEYVVIVPPFFIKLVTIIVSSYRNSLAKSCLIAIT